MQFAIPIVGRTERSHTARVRTSIAIQHALVIAGRFQQKIIFSVHESVQRTFRAAQKFLDHDAPACIAEATLTHHLINSRPCGSRVGGDGYPLTQRQAVCLDYHRKFRQLTVAERLAAIGKCARFSSGDFLRAHQFFCENFRRLYARCRFRRAERAQFFSGEQIDNSRSKRIVRTNYSQIDTIFFRETNDSLQITCGKRDILGNFPGASVSRRAENALRMRRLSQFPSKRVFAATAANHENFHRGR